MKLDINEIAHSIGMQYTYQVDDDESVDLAESGIIFYEPVRGTLHFSNTGHLLLVRGRLKTTIEVQCVRCLSPFASAQDFEVEEQFALHPWEALGKEEDDDDEVDMEPSDQDMADDLYHDGILDLSELVRQVIIVNSPIAPLCEEECRGLCSVCGANLNESDCGHKAEVELATSDWQQALASWSADEG